MTFSMSPDRNRRKPALRPAVMEAVEHRRMMSVSIASGNSFSEVSGNYWATAIAGDNGNPDGVPTGEAGHGDTLLASSYTILDSNLDDGLDSGWLTVQFAVNKTGNGSGSWVFSDSGTSTFTAGAGSVSQVQIQCAVTGAFLASEWRNLTVSFYNAGTLTETITVGSISANTMDPTTNDPKETIATVTPTTTGNNGVFVVGQVRLQAAEGTYAAQTDVFSSINIT